MTPRTSPRPEDTARAIMFVSLGSLVLLGALALLAGTRIENRAEVLRGFAIAIAIAFPLCLFAGTIPPKVRTLVFIAGIIMLYGFLYQSVGYMQHILFFGWKDASVVGFEMKLTGTDIPVYLQRFTTPLLTEGLMFAYVTYGALILATAFACSHGEDGQAALEYLLAFSIANIICDIGFILFPVAGPLRFNPGQYTIPLNGGLFTMCGEWVRTSLHLPGESLPSAHCAVTTVMLIMLFRHNRKFFWLTLPTLLAVYPATIYCRYHYFSDAVTGTAVGILSVWFVPALTTAVVRLETSVARRFHIRIPGRTALT